jgi:hypothetical protein
VRRLWMGVAVLAVLVLAGCSGRTQPLAQQSSVPPSPSPVASVTTEPPPSPPPPIVAPTLTGEPTGKVRVDCTKLPTTVTGVYWQVQAVPPATCKQANSVMNQILSHPETNSVDGWQCHEESTDAIIVNNNRVDCTKGQLEVDAELTLKS